MQCSLGDFKMCLCWDAYSSITKIVGKWIDRQWGKMFAGDIKLLRAVKGKRLQNAAGGCHYTEWLGNKTKDKFSTASGKKTLSVYSHCVYIFIDGLKMNCYCSEGRLLSHCGYFYKSISLIPREN